jgi:Zn-dependent protease/CBS domain-containing protein
MLAEMWSGTAVVCTIKLDAPLLIEPSRRIPHTGGVCTERLLFDSPRGSPVASTDSQRERPEREPAPTPGTVRIARILGFDILIHWSWLIIATLFTWTLAAGYFPGVYPDWSAEQRWIAAAITSILFFGSVLVHELSHSVVARARGLDVTSITLFVFGGVSSLGGEPRSAKDEFWIAIVGPLTSFAIAGLAALIWLAAREQGATVPQAIAGYLAYINVAVGIFNLLPGFPLDGGRVLRSAVWGAKGNMLAATRVAANAGRVVAAILIAIGILTVFGGALGGLWLAVIGWFLWNAAESSYQQLLLQNSLQGLTAGALAGPSPVRVPPDISLREFAEHYLLSHNHRAFFVGVEGGDPLGLITLSDLQKEPRDQWDTISVFRAMTPRERLITVTPQTPAMDALQLMAEHNINQLPVVNGREFVGLLTRAALIRAIQFRSEIGRRN